MDKLKIELKPDRRIFRKEEKFQASVNYKLEEDEGIIWDFFVGSSESLELSRLILESAIKNKDFGKPLSKRQLQTEYEVADLSNIVELEKRLESMRFYGNRIDIDTSDHRFEYDHYYTILAAIITNFSENKDLSYEVLDRECVKAEGSIDILLEK